MSKLGWKLLTGKRWNSTSQGIPPGKEELLCVTGTDTFTGEITMHPLRKLRESGKATPAQVSALLAENIVFNSPLLVRPVEGREVIAAIFAQSSSTRGSGTYTAEFKLDERTTFLHWEGTMDDRELGGHRGQRAGADRGAHYRPSAVSGGETIP